METEAVNQPGGKAGVASEIMSRLRDTMTARMVIGEPVTSGNATVIPVVRANGLVWKCGVPCCGGRECGDGEGGEGGSSESSNAEGTGMAVRSKVIGAFVIKNDEVAWHPAVDMTKVILIGQLVGVTALLVVRAALRAGRRR